MILRIQEVKVQRKVFFCVSESNSTLSKNKVKLHLSNFVISSCRYPTKDWKVAGEFDLRDERTVQTLPITDAQDYYAKFVRVELLEHFGDEHFCPLTIFR